jgi:CBS domain containing-hemolysin-like protein
VKRTPTVLFRLALAAAVASIPDPAHASLFSGPAADKVANFMAWVVLIIVPIVGISVFWLVHILPEKIAEKRNHPQATAIHVLCLLSLVFGGLLWPLAWLWAYSKPVFYKMAYGTDQGEHGEHPESGGDDHPPSDDTRPGLSDADEVKSLRARVAELESRLARVAPEGQKA